MFWYKCSQNRRISSILSTSLYFHWLLKLVLRVILMEVYFCNRTLLNFRIVQVRRRIHLDHSILITVVTVLLILVSQPALGSVLITSAGLFGCPTDCIHLLLKKIKTIYAQSQYPKQNKQLPEEVHRKKTLNLPQPVLCKERRGHFPPAQQLSTSSEQRAACSADQQGFRRHSPLSSPS